MAVFMKPLMLLVDRGGGPGWLRRGQVMKFSTTAQECGTVKKWWK